MPKLNEWLFGGGDKFKKMDTMSPEKSQMFQQFMQMLSGMMGQGGGGQQSQQYFQDLMNPESDLYKNFEKPYLQEFEQQTIPGIAERFGGMGAMGGALSSSGFGQALSSAGSNLQTNLAGMKSGMQQDAAKQLQSMFQNMMGLGLGTPEFAYGQKQGHGGSFVPLMSAFFKAFGG
jgi:hypothetical protein